MKTLKNVLVIALVLIAVPTIYFQYLRYTFVDRMIKLHTHIDNYRIIQKAHDDQQWYAKALISNSDGEKLSHLYPFKYGFNPIYSTGKYRNDYIKNDDNYWYYFDGKGQGPYGYILYRLDKTKTKLEIYDLFAN